MPDGFLCQHEAARILLGRLVSASIFQGFGAEIRWCYGSDIAVPIFNFYPEHGFYCRTRCPSRDHQEK